MATEIVRRTCAGSYDEGTLRAYLDGELEPERSAAIQEHARSCADCGERLTQLRLTGALAQGRLALLDADAAALPSRPAVAAILAAARHPQRPAWRAAVEGALARLRESAWRPAPLAAGAAVAVVLLGGAAMTQPAVQSFAQGVVQSLRVQKVQPVKLDLTQLSGGSLPGIDQLLSTGTYQGPTEPSVRSATPAEASKATGFTVRAPSRLPAQVTGSRSVWVSDPVSFTFTYNGDKLAALAQQYGVTDASLLASLRGLNGTTVKGTVPAAAGIFYGQLGPAAQRAGAARDAAKHDLAKVPQATQAAGGGGQPFLALVQLKTPGLDVPANVDQLRSQLLKSGAVPPALAAQLLAIQDWKTTLPVPVVHGQSQQVAVDGVTGTLFTGDAPMPVLFWQKDGVVYVLAASGSPQDVLDAARSLAPAK